MRTPPPRKPTPRSAPKSKPKTRPAAPASRRLPSQKRSRETVDALLLATAHILERDGWDGVTTNRVAERAGVNVASLYQYFPSKDALVGELLRRHLGDRRAAAQKVLEASRGRGAGPAIRAQIEAALAEHAVEPRLHAAFAEVPSRVRAEAADPAAVDASDPRDAVTRELAAAQPNPALSAWLVQTVVRRVIEQPAGERPAGVTEAAVVDELAALLGRYLKR